jgi:hypothetical protein
MYHVKSLAARRFDTDWHAGEFAYLTKTSWIRENGLAYEFDVYVNVFRKCPRLPIYSCHDSRSSSKYRAAEDVVPRLHRTQ